MKKIIQIAVNNQGLFALCADGNIYYRQSGKWKKTEPIPEFSKECIECKGLFDDKVESNFCSKVCVLENADQERKF